jgi:hypothetical protein
VRTAPQRRAARARAAYSGMASGVNASIRIIVPLSVSRTRPRSGSARDRQHAATTPEEDSQHQQTRSSRWTTSRSYAAPSSRLRSLEERPSSAGSSRSRSSRGRGPPVRRPGPAMSDGGHRRGRCRRHR